MNLFDCVKLSVERHGYPAGTRGCIVDLYPGSEYVTVELMTEHGDTLAVVPVYRDEVEPR